MSVLTHLREFAVVHPPTGRIATAAFDTEGRGHVRVTVPNVDGASMQDPDGLAVVRTAEGLPLSLPDGRVFTASLGEDATDEQVLVALCAIAPSGRAVIAHRPQAEEVR